MEPGPCIVCGAPAHNGHHRKLRSQGGGDEHWNILRTCGSGTTGCHGLIHANPEAAYDGGLLVHSWDDPREIEVDVPLFINRVKIVPHPDGRGAPEVDGGESYHAMGELLGVEHDHAAVEEGKECPTCHRRVPHKKKPTSPVTKVMGVRVPVGDVEDFEEQLVAGAKYLGCYEKTHWKFWLWQYALVALLQTPEMEGALEEVPS